MEDINIDEVLFKEIDFSTENIDSEPRIHNCITENVQLNQEGLTLLNEFNINPNSITELVVGVGPTIPLWDRDVKLRWRFHPMMDTLFKNPTKAKGYIRKIFNRAQMKWGNSAPIEFIEADSNIDFEIIIRKDKCSNSGCTLASAFFPSTKKNYLTLYPMLFKRSVTEQIETLIHEIGHIFGLRHYFAKSLENQISSQIFGHHHPVTIMNYGPNSRLTDKDQEDLHKLYYQVWSGQLKHINGDPIALFKPLSQLMA